MEINWISVRDKEPELGQEVLICGKLTHENPYISIAIYKGDYDFIPECDEHDVSFINVRHWYPIEEINLPKQKEEKYYPVPNSPRHVDYPLHEIINELYERIIKLENKNG